MHKKGFYEKFLKRPFDFVLSLLALILLSPLLLIIAILVRIKLGAPVLFKQPRPGLNEKVFNLYKFRTMTNQKDSQGNLLSDDVRLTKFGKFLRSTSLDELPSLINILKGNLSVVGPRPQLIKDMVFMADEQRQRHIVRQGLTGLAQVNGRNAIAWEDKIRFDIEYIHKITFLKDIIILFKTLGKVFKREGVSQEGMETAEDLGDYLLRIGKISSTDHHEKLEKAKEIEREETL